MGKEKKGRKSDCKVKLRKEGGRPGAKQKQIGSLTLREEEKRKAEREKGQKREVG